MIMADRISMIYSILDPEGLVGALALGTVAITAAIVTDLILAAKITPVLMPSKSCCPASGHCPKNPELIPVGLVLFDKPPTKSFNNLSHFMPRAAHKASL
jgi:hypothetical protein